MTSALDIPVDFEVSWLAGSGLPRERGRALLRLLRQLARSGSLREAAAAAGVPYRSAWDILTHAEGALGAPLAEMRRGSRARLSSFGQKLVAAEERVQQALADPLRSLAAELNLELADTAPTKRPRLRLYGSHDLALAQLAESCGGAFELLLEFRGGDESIAALSRGECDVAGFHVADALPRAAAAAAALGKWLDPRRHGLARFVTREQGLIVRPGSRIKSVNDLTRPGVRFVHRHDVGNPAATISNGSSVAVAVAEGRADAAFGLRAEAARFKLGFVPLAVERYFFAFARSSERGGRLQALFRILKGQDFQTRVRRLAGYDAAHSGRRESIDHALSWLRQSPRGRAKRREAARGVQAAMGQP